MSAEQTYETKRIDHLGIISWVSREIGLIEQIDSYHKNYKYRLEELIILGRITNKNTLQTTV